MAVVIWKDGECSTCAPERLQNNLNAGYTLVKNPPKKRGRPFKTKTPEDLSSLMEPTDGPTSES
jgi:hypothetical protein